MELKLTTALKIDSELSIAPANLTLIASATGFDAAELAELITASGIMDAAAEMGLDPFAAVDAALGTPDGFDALLGGDGRAALDAALDTLGKSFDFGFGTIGGSDPDAGGFPGGDNTMMDGDGWHTGRGVPNYQTAEPGDIVYDSNGDEAGVMTKYGINIFLDGHDSNGDGKADTAVDGAGVVYLDPQKGLVPEPDEDPEGTNGGGDDDSGGDDGSDSGEDGTGKGDDGTDTGGDDDDEPDTGEDDTAVTGSGTDGTTQPGDGSGTDGPVDTLDFKDDDGTTQPGFDDNSSTGTVDTIGLQPGYGTTQPGFDSFDGGGVIVINEPGYGQTQPGLTEPAMLEPFDLAFM